MAEGDGGLDWPAPQFTPAAQRVRSALLRQGIAEHRVDEATVAVVRALLAPDNKMLKAAAKALSPERRPTDRYVSVKAKHAIRFRAMLRAAIGDETPVLRSNDTEKGNG